MDEDDDDLGAYAVVVNDEEQYTIWLDCREIPAGWHREGTVGTKSECLVHIEKVWRDVRPLSLRKRIGDVL